MTVSDLYLTCFLVGFALSLLSVLAGGIHLHIHLPIHFHLGHVPHLPHAGGSNALPAINLGTATAFLAWFGGVGYLLTRHSHVYAMAALLLSIVSGFVGATLVFLLVTRFLMRFEAPLDPADFEMVGVLGRVTSRLRQGGTGEIVFSRMGARCSSPARSDEGREIEKDVEVVVTRYEHGIAYVQRWDEMAASAGVEADRTQS